MASTWKRNWTPHYTPNKVTKDKLTKYRQEKTQRHISLHLTAGRHQMKSSRYWSPRPNRGQNLPANHPSVRQCQLNKVRYRNSPSLKEPHQRRTPKEMSPAGSLSDPDIVASSGEETESADEFQLDNLSPQSPPDHERGPQPIEYVPKSPVYPPPSDPSSDEESRPGLESCSGQMTPETEEPQKDDSVHNMEVPADVNADKDHFQDDDRQNILRKKLSQELRQAPWNEDTSGQPLKELRRLMKTVKPAHQEFWNQVSKDRETFLTLDAVAKKLEASQTEAKRDQVLQAKEVKDQVSPGDVCVTCQQPVGHHLVESCKTPCKRS